MLAIYKRELKSYFCTFIGFLFVAVLLAFIGLYFSAYNLMRGYPYFAYAISGITFLLLVSVPVLTMRILAEEKRSKTDQLILTAPVSVGGIVMGKFLALLTIFAIPMGISCIYPLIMTRYGSVPLGEAYLAILAYFLFGMAALAIGLLISSVTESQVIAAVLSFGVLSLGYLMSSLCNVISATGNWVTKILGCFDLNTPFIELLNGTLNVSSVVYYVSVTALALFLAVQSIQKRRYSVSVKNFSFGAYSTGMIAVAVAIVVLVNIMLGEMSASWTAIDLTQQKLYSLTDQTKQYVQNMQEDVTIYVLIGEEEQDTILEQTLQRYDDLSEHITVEYVDPTVNPTFHMQYTDSDISMNSLIFVSEKRSKVVDYTNIYESNIDYTTYTATTTGYDGEGQITSALDFVLTDSMPKLYMTEGHNEMSLSNTFLTALEKENVEYESIHLMNYETIPEDAACLFINHPVSDFSADDKDKVINYLRQGGKVILISGYSGKELTNVEAIAAFMGLQLTDGMVVEQNMDNYYRYPYYVLPIQEYSTYTNGLYGEMLLFTPYVRGIQIIDESNDEMTYTQFLKTSDMSFAKTDMTNEEDYIQTENDIQGPFAIGVEAVLSMGGGEATMVLYSGEQIFTDDASAIASGANLTLFTNTISSFVNHDSSISVPVKSYSVSLLTVPQTDLVVLQLITIIILPLGCLAAGLIIWFRRRLH